MNGKHYSFEIGDNAPINEKAINSTTSLCTDCGKALGLKPLHFEVNTCWQLIEPNTDPDNSQGLFAIGRNCALKFNPKLLVDLGAK